MSGTTKCTRSDQEEEVDGTSTQREIPLDKSKEEFSSLLSGREDVVVERSESPIGRVSQETLKDKEGHLVLDSEKVLSDQAAVITGGTSHAELSRQTASLLPQLRVPQLEGYLVRLLPLAEFVRMGPIGVARNLKVAAMEYQLTDNPAEITSFVFWASAVHASAELSEMMSASIKSDLVEGRLEAEEAEQRQNQGKAVRARSKRQRKGEACRGENAQADDGVSVDWLLAPKDVWIYIMALSTSVFDVVALSRTCKSLSVIGADRATWWALLRQKPGLCKWHEAEGRLEPKLVYFDCEICRECMIPADLTLLNASLDRAKRYRERVSSKAVRKKDAFEAFELIFNQSIKDEERLWDSFIREHVSDFWTATVLLSPGENAGLLYGLSKVEQMYDAEKRQWLFDDPMVLAELITHTRWSRPLKSLKETIDDWIEENEAKFEYEASFNESEHDSDSHPGDGYGDGCSNCGQFGHYTNNCNNW